MTEPGNEIERRPNVDSWISVVVPISALAERIAKTEFVPAAMRNKPEAVAAATLTGRELNMSPLTALRSINVIEGRPSLSAEALGALIMRAGHRIEWLESTEKSATVHIQRFDGLSEATVTWTMREAERAGLTRKSNWQKYPRDMLRHRALTEAARMACPDISLGLDTGWLPETIQPEPEGTVSVQIAPATRQSAPRNDPEPEPVSETVEPEATSEAPVEASSEPTPDAPVTPEQLKRMHSIVTEMQRIGDKRLTATEKRNFIVRHAGLDPADVVSLRQLTQEQAGWAIASLHQARELMKREREDGEPAQSH